MTLTLADAATMGAGYIVSVANEAAGNITVGLASAADTIDTVTNATQILSPKETRTYIVNAATTGYISKSSHYNIDQLTAETAPATDDLLVLRDTSTSTTDKITLENLLKVVNSLTEDTSPDESNDFVLTYDASAGAAKKVKPDNIVPSAASGASLVLLTSLTASNSASLAFTSLPNGVYETFVFEGDNVLPATDGVQLVMQMSVDNGASYEAGTSYQVAVTGLVSDGTSGSANSTGNANIPLSGTTIENTISGGGISFSLRAKTLFSTNQNKHVFWSATSANNASATFTASHGGAAGASATLTNNDVDAIRFLMSSGNIAFGTIRMYGLKKA